MTKAGVRWPLGEVGHSRKNGVLLRPGVANEGLTSPSQSPLFYSTVDKHTQQRQRRPAHCRRWGQGRGGSRRRRTLFQSQGRELHMHHNNNEGCAGHHHHHHHHHHDDVSCVGVIRSWLWPEGGPWWLEVAIVVHRWCHQQWQEWSWWRCWCNILILASAKESARCARV